MSKTKTYIDPTMVWKLHTPNLLSEILTNKGTEILWIPMHLLCNLLGQVAQRAASLHDPELDALMMALTLYSVADPESPDYRPGLIDRHMQRVDRIKHCTRPVIVPAPKKPSRPRKRL